MTLVFLQMFWVILIIIIILGLYIWYLLGGGIPSYFIAPFGVFIFLLITKVWTGLALLPFHFLMPLGFFWSVLLSFFPSILPLKALFLQPSYIFFSHPLLLIQIFSILIFHLWNLQRCIQLFRMVWLGAYSLLWP